MRWPLLLLLAAAACSHGTAPPPAAPAASPPPPPPAARVANGPCPSPLPVPVLTLNKTRAHGDLCAAFNAAVAPIPNPAALAAGGFELQVVLTKLETAPTASCEVKIALIANHVVVSIATDGASHAQAGREAARDCVEAVINSVVTNSIVPKMLQLLAQQGTP